MDEYIDEYIRKNDVYNLKNAFSSLIKEESTKHDGIEWVIYNRASESALNMIERGVQEIPAADVVEVVHGQWINAIGNYQVAECSNCKKWFEPCPEEKPRKDFFECFCEDYKFCPNCGAKMDLEEQTV